MPATSEDSLQDIADFANYAAKDVDRKDAIQSAVALREIANRCRALAAESQSVTISDNAWKETGPDDDKSARLLASITLNDISMHVEAYAVDPDDELEQSVLDEDADIALCKLIGDGGWPVYEHVIRGRRYIVVATPYGD